MLSDKKLKEISECVKEYGRDYTCEKFKLSKETLRRYIRFAAEDEKEPIDHDNNIILQRLAEKFSPGELKAFLKDKIDPKHGKVTYNFEGDTIKFAVISDSHIGSQYTVESRITSSLDLCKEEGVKLLLMPGDITEGMSGREGHVYELQHIGYQAQRQATIDILTPFKNDFDIKMVSGNHDCLDSETELLTRRGWIKYNEIDINKDRVLSYNHETNKCRWDKINDVIIKKGESFVLTDIEGYSFKGTEKHRVLCSKRKVKRNGEISYSDMQYIEAGQLAGRIKIPCSRQSENKDFDISDNMLRLSGWLMTDGSISDRGYFIYQSKPIDKIEKILKDMNLDYTVNTRERDITEVCGKKLKKKPLPQKTIKIKVDENIKTFMPSKKIQNWMNDLSDRQFMVMFHSIIDGDGSRYQHTEDSFIIYGTEKFLSDLQGLCVSHGLRSSLSTDNRGTFRLNVTKKTDIEFDSYLNVKKIKSSEEVWCLSVPLTNFMVRRKGTAYFTGNCWYAAKANMGALIVKDICESIGAEYLGEHEAVININGVKIMLWHGEDGSSYALSYRIQKIIESLSGGEKPNILITGHDHKQGYFFTRNIHAVLGGCLQKQTPWMRRKKLAAHEGFWIIEARINDSEVKRFKPEWIPFYV